jgi:hypothetical protein
MVMKFVRDQYPQARFERIYNASKDGWDSDDFHRCCDKKEGTLTIVKTTDNFIFGGFTLAEWTAPGLAEDILPKIGYSVLGAAMILLRPIEGLSVISDGITHTSTESKLSSESFLFSVNQGNKYPITGEDKPAIICDRRYCAVFGNCLAIDSDSNNNTDSLCLANQECYNLPPASGESNERNSSTINGGKRNFKSLELEVY